MFNKGTYTSRVYIASGGVINVASGATLTGVGVWRLGSAASSSESFIYINGGTFNSTGTGTAGLTLGYAAKGTINIDNGGTYNFSAGTTTGGLIVGTSTASGTININSGTLNYTSAIALSINVTNGLINIDAGSLILNGNQTAALNTYISNGQIAVSGAALLAGKTPSANYDPVTGKTTVIAVVPSNAAPVANNDAITVAPSGTATILVGGATSVLTNDTDADSNPLTAVVVTGPVNGSLTLYSNGTFSYIHNGSATTTDSFTYKANDGAVDSNIATVNITISSVNIAPVANNDAFSVKQGGISTVLTGGATSVLTNDTDAENNTLTATVVTSPVNGTLTLNANGTFSYLHNNSATTTDSFTYKANDGALDSTIATVNITVTAPVATTNIWTGGASTDFLAASNWTASDAPNPTVFTTLSSFSIPTGTTNSPELNANYSSVSGAANCATLTVDTGAVLTTNANLTTNTATSSVSGTLNINAGTLNSPKFYIGNAASTAGVVNVATGATLTGNNTWRIGANATGTGTLNINGGTLTLGTSGDLSLGYASTGVLNINSGTVNVNYTAFTSFAITSNGTVNIDGGSMVIPGDQTIAVQVFIDAGRILSVSGKILSNTYDAGTGKTTVVAITAPLGVNDVALDANAITVYAQDKNIKVQSRNVLMAEVKVYDLTGRLVASKKSIGSNEASVAVDASNAVYVIKVTTADGKVVTKKITQ